MTTLTDIYGRVSTQADDNTWTIDGITLGPCDADQAITTFNGMAPDNYVPPAAPIVVPYRINNAQLRVVLLTIPSTTPGPTLFDDVDAFIKSVGGSTNQIWEYANTIMRDGVFINQIATHFALSSDQLDHIFIQGNSISM